jgi:carbon monoxide dehydrogenase subunit G
LAPITASAEIGRAPEDVFTYVTDPSRFAEWQEGVVDGRTEGSGVGARCITTRRIGFMKQTTNSEITELSPPHTWSVRGIDGPIRAQVDVRVEPLDGGARSRATIDVDFEGHGLGKLLVPLAVRREAEKKMPRNLRRLKEHLEQAQ